MESAGRERASWHPKDRCASCQLVSQGASVFGPKLESTLWDFRNKGHFTDAKVILDNGLHIPVHKNVLAAASQTLDSLIEGDLVPLRGMSEEVCMTMLEVIYTRKNRVTHSNVHSLKEVARRLKLTGLSRECQDLLDSVHPPSSTAKEEEEGPRRKRLERYRLKTHEAESVMCGSLGQLLEAQHQHGRFTDLEVVVEGETFMVHQNVLAARSPYFFAMLKHPMIEKQSRKVTLSISVAVWRVVLEWLYGVSSNGLGKDTLQSIDLVALMDAAEMMLLVDLKVAISMHLAREISEDNIFDFYQTYCLYHVPSIHVFLLDHFTSLSCEPEFMELEAGLVLEVLACPRVKVVNEEAVCTCIFNWLLDNPHASKKDMMSLIAQIRPADLSLAYLDQTWWRLQDLGPVAFQLMVDMLDTERRLRNATKREPLVPADKVPRPRGLQTDRNVYGDGDRLVAVAHSRRSIDLLEWDFVRKTWHKRFKKDLVEVEVLSSHQAVISPGDRSVLVMALHDKASDCSCMLLSMGSEITCHLNVCRELSDGFPKGMFVLVVSGKDFYSVQKPAMVIRKLDRSGQVCKWVEVGHLPFEVRNLTAVATEKYLVVVGFTKGRDWGTMIQSYNLHTHQWGTYPLNVEDRYRFHQGVVLGGEIWFVGLFGHLTQVCCEGDRIQLIQKKDVLGMQRVGKVAAVTHKNGSIALVGGLNAFHKSDECITVHPYGGSVARLDNDIDTSCPEYNRDILAAAVMHLPYSREAPLDPRSSD